MLAPGPRFRGGCAVGFLADTPPLACARHVTSKLHSIADLIRIPRLASEVLVSVGSAAQLRRRRSRPGGVSACVFAQLAFRISAALAEA